MKKTIVYFEKAGPENTSETLKLAKERADELGIKDIVIASSHGGTALKATDFFDLKENNVVAVTICESFKDLGWTMKPEEREKLESKGIRVLTCIHALGDNVGSAFTEKHGGITPERVVRETLYRFCQGMKVAVEIVLMAADAGLIPVDREVIAIAGTDEGADTAIVVQPTYPRKFHELKIKEIIAKPREP